MELSCYTEDSETRAVLQTGFRQPELADLMLLRGLRRVYAEQFLLLPDLHGLCVRD